MRHAGSGQAAEEGSRALPPFLAMSFATKDVVDTVWKWIFNVQACEQKPFLAFDLGAESGRAILARLHSGVLTTQEIHRFKNEPVEYGGSLHWDVARLWWEMRKA